MANEPKEVSIEHKGRKITGTVTVSNRMVTVSTPLGSKTTQLGGSPAELLARLMLRELADEGKA